MIGCLSSPSTQLSRYLGLLGAFSLAFPPAASHGPESFAGIEIAVLSDQCRSPTTARRPRPSLVCQTVSREASQVSQLLNQCLFSFLHPFS